MFDLLDAAHNDMVGIMGGLLVGFTFGSIPFGYLLVRVKTGDDVFRGAATLGLPT